MSNPPANPAAAQVYKHGFGLKKDVAEELNRRYNDSRMVAHLRSHGNTLTIGDVRIYLAEEFGFCYGVDKAIDFAYETRKHFPDRRIFLTDEIIHNPRVNHELMEIGIQFLSGAYAGKVAIDDLNPEDVVIIPAFGTTTVLEKRLRDRGCVLVDTTCGSVVHVWKRVEKYAEEGFTAVIHGKFNHEETRATSSRVLIAPGAKYVIVRDKGQAELVCKYIATGGKSSEFLQEFDGAMSRGFDPDKDLEQIGVANQTTMLASESMEIAEMLQNAIVKRYGEDRAGERFRSFDTICRATQDRQDALLRLRAQENISLFLVIGGYNSSNTSHLLEMAIEKCPAYHVQDATDLISKEQIRHKPLGQNPSIDQNWMTKEPVSLGVTSGASTPNRVLEEVMLRFLELRGYSPAEVFSCLAA
ncbi:MAG: 4-hydroxy-3-methylbut-2-enyl diphosphate reductase [Candidatus Omnitrophica bacterium]|nr:4-hydroxy-3-methylbut-2-enyl diphosphate reductase [Candidatus Omnitrophota bacterium]